MNSSKYGRLYPERAVVPLRLSVERTLASQHIPASLRAKLEGGLRLLDSDGFPPDEPLFLLRGQDTLAPEIVRAYAGKVLEAGAFAPNTLETGGHIMDFADRMAAWQPRKRPD